MDERDALRCGIAIVLTIMMVIIFIRNNGGPIAGEYGMEAHHGDRRLKPSPYNTDGSLRTPTA